MMVRAKSLRGIWAVFREFRETCGQGTLLSALVFGHHQSHPGQGLAVQHLARRDTVRREHRRGGAFENAPTNRLLALRRRHQRLLDEAAARISVMTQTHKIILEIPADFGARLQEGQPAPVVLYSDSSRGFERRGVGRVRALVSNYGIEIAQLRFLARGIDPISVLPISVQEIDVHTQRPFGAGAQHDDLPGAAVDAVRRPVSRHRRHRRRTRTRFSRNAVDVARAPRASIYGKTGRRRVHAHIAGAHGHDVAGASALTCADLGVRANLGPAAAAQMVACCAPLILFGSAYLTIISAFAKTYREAQTYLQLVITVPTLPLIFAGLLGLQPKLGLMFVPFLSQHLLMTTVVRAEEIEPLHMMVSVGTAGIRRDPHLHRRPALPAKPCWAGPTFPDGRPPAAESPRGAARAARDSEDFRR
jgi:sodium transport system permease protein